MNLDHQLKHTPIMMETKDLYLDWNPNASMVSTSFFFTLQAMILPVLQKHAKQASGIPSLLNSTSNTFTSFFFRNSFTFFSVSIASVLFPNHGSEHPVSWYSIQTVGLIFSQPEQIMSTVKTPRSGIVFFIMLLIHLFDCKCLKKKQLHKKVSRIWIASKSQTDYRACLKCPFRFR